MNNNNQNVLDDDRIGRLLLKLSLPAFVGMFVITLYNVVDTIFIGRYVGPLGIAGLSIVFPVQMLSMGIGQMTGMGGASVISRLIGAGNIPKAERALGNAITSTIVLSAALMIIGLSDADFWLRLMGASETILPYARDYMTIILIGMFFQTFAMALNGLIRAEGNARVPMTGMIIGAVVNVILDAIFIIPLAMGIKGAALATVIAQFISVAYFLRYYFYEKGFLKIYSRNLVPELGILREILAIGIASFARTVAGSITAIFVNRVLVAYGGDFAVSAFGIVNRIMMFALMPSIVIGLGLQPIIGFNYGAKRYDKAMKAIKMAIVAATACCVIVFAVLYLAPEPIIGIFTTDNGLIALGVYAMKRVFLFLYLIGFIMVGSIIFQSTGKATQSFATAVARPFLFLLPVIFILPRFLQLDGVWLAFPISDVLTGILTLILLVPQIRELRRKDIFTGGEAIIGVH
ncbi:MAG TPA: MATE family efflux transporter [Dehalococcoidia bacterium]|nr:MATE family efflux transporter [Dehalococcoidia bacterium]